MTRVRGSAIGATLVAVAILGPQGSLADQGQDRGRGQSLKTFLTGFQEPPAVSSTGRGEFAAKVDRDGTFFEYELSYRDLEGTITQAHVHIGQLSVNGGIAIWLCQTAGTPAPESVSAATPFCPGPNSGTGKGVVTAAQVIGPAGQGVNPGEFAEVLRAMGAGAAYANVHSSRNLGGEIRGQIRNHGRDDERH